MLCSQVYHDDGLEGQLLFNYFQIRFHIAQGSQVHVCCWWQMISAACCSQVFIWARKYRVLLIAALASSAYRPAPQPNSKNLHWIRFCCKPRSCSCWGFRKTEVHPEILAFSWSKHAQHTIFLPRDVLDKLGIMGWQKKRSTHWFCHLQMKHVNTNVIINCWDKKCSFLIIFLCHFVTHLIGKK